MARQMLEEFRQGALTEPAVGEVRAHLAACPRCATLNEADQALTQALHLRLPRHPVPPALRARVLQSARPGRWGLSLANPWVSATVAAALVLFVLLPFLLRGRSPDRIAVLAAEVKGEHLRAVLMEDARGREDHDAEIARLSAKTGIALSWVYAGDEEIRLTSVRPVLVMGRTGLGLVYQDRVGRIATYLVFSGEEVTIPPAGRVQVASYRPYWGTANGYSLILWKQDGLNCVLVSDWEREPFLGLFLKVRRGTGREQPK